MVATKMDKSLAGIPKEQGRATHKNAKDQGGEENTDQRKKRIDTDFSVPNFGLYLRRQRKVLGEVKVGRVEEKSETRGGD